ncbi:type I DNA topoisomerase [bacterium]|nr:type I DNA topoisomerase [bacterium]MBU1984996.1 type I DNA topoisomerase [bacterium]
MPKTPSKTRSKSPRSTSKKSSKPSKKPVAKKPAAAGKAVAKKTSASRARKTPASAKTSKTAKRSSSAARDEILTSAPAQGLVIVESPAKARTITAYLGKDFHVQATVGHIWDLPPKRLGVDVEHDFEPEYEVITGKQDVIKALKKSADGVRHIFLATDPDREGEAIAYHVAKELGNGRRELHRVLFNEITRDSIRKAIAAPGSIDERKVEAQQARRVLDRLVGYLVSPLLQKIIARGLSAGRVQSVALRLICEREAEIRAFVSEEYWTIEALLRATKKETFVARLVKIEGKKPELKDEKSAKTAVAQIRKHPFVLTDLKVRPAKSQPSPPYTTSTLQQDAARRLGFSNDRTMGVAQALYEGIKVGAEGLVGLITYMRTDSTRLAPEAVAAMRDYVGGRFGPEFVPDKPRVFAAKKSAQDAHEAIRPTDVNRDPASVKKYLTVEQFKLYNMIWQRALASQMADAQFEVTTAQLMAGEYEFRAIGRRLLFAGHLQVMAALTEEKPQRPNGDDEPEDTRLLPELRVGKEYPCEEVTPTQHFTEPPARFNSASLVKTLDELGIGRPSTYASIISVLVKRRYMEQKERRFHPTTLGETVNRILVDQFPDIFDVKFTAKMEEELDSVENEGLAWKQVVRDFYEPFSKRLEKVNQNRHTLRKASEEVTDKKCPKCDSHLIVKWGRAGQFLGCSNYPDCKHTEPLESEKAPEVPETACPSCGKPMTAKRSRFGWFLGCTGYPSCRTTLPLVNGESVPCPRAGCDGRVSQKKSRKGRTFWGCSKYPECDFISWYKPILEPCPSCGHHYMEDKPLKSGHIRQCPKCRHKIAVEETTEK